MPNIDQWDASGLEVIDPAQRAKDAWMRISHDPISVVFNRGNTLLDAQTVRVGIDSSGPELPTQAGQNAGVQTLTVYGVRDHPSDAVPDTDMRRGDRFNYGGKTYTISGVVVAPGEVQGFGEVAG